MSRETPVLAAAESPELAPELAPQTASVAEPTPTPQQVAALAPQKDTGAAQDVAVFFEPPVPGQGGTCISGSIIDVYHQAMGANWTVKVTSQEGTSQSAQADANGRFQIASLSGGTWTVELEVPGGWRPFTPASFPVTLSGSGGNCAQVRFKVETLACLDVTKLDANGQMGAQQRFGIPGWRMTATQGATVLEEITDWQGKCRFVNLVPGVWTVEEEAQSGWQPAAGSGARQTIQLESPRTPGVCQSLIFINQQVHEGCVRVRKVDTAGNPLKDWTITLTRDDGTRSSTAKTTDEAGYATFDGLALGQWTVREEIKAGWRAVESSTQKANLTEPGRCVEVSFKNELLPQQQFGCVDGYKINHLNAGLAGWTIKAQNTSSGEEKNAVTDSSGYFKIPNLTPGTWRVSEVLQTGWEPVTPAELELQVVATTGECQRVRFKNQTDLACVDVYKKDAVDDSGLPGWEITLQPAYGGSPVTGTTDGTGHVRFNGLTPGIYDISEKGQANWTATTPQTQRVELEATGSCHIVTFKNRQQTAPASNVCRVTYKVRRGNTLYSIATQHGTTVAALKQANNLTSNTILVNQQLCIP